MKIIPRNKEVADEFEAKLKNTAFASTDQFIMLYNQNIINKSNDKTNEVAQEITRTYKNVILKNRMLIVQSEEELVVENFAFILPNMALVSQLKRIVKNIMKENYPENTALIFKESDDGVIYVVDTDGEEPPHVYDGAEKISKLNSLIASNPFLVNLVFDYEVEGEENAGAILATSLLEVNTEFISKIGELLESSLKGGE